MEKLIVIFIVAAAALFVARSLYKQFTGKSGCSGGCSCSQEIQNHCSQDKPHDCS